jgi:hypothetical protein
MTIRKAMIPPEYVEEFTDAIQALLESAAQAPYDFCGDQRAWHLPRLQKIQLTLMKLFPRQSIDAMLKAKDPYGNPLCPDDDKPS